MEIAELRIAILRDFNSNEVFCRFKCVHIHTVDFAYLEWEEETISLIKIQKAIVFNYNKFNIAHCNCLQLSNPYFPFTAWSNAIFFPNFQFTVFRKKNRRERELLRVRVEIRILCENRTIKFAFNEEDSSNRAHIFLFLSFHFISLREILSCFCTLFRALHLSVPPVERFQHSLCSSIWIAEWRNSGERGRVGSVAGGMIVESIIIYIISEKYSVFDGVHFENMDESRLRVLLWEREKEDWTFQSIVAPIQYTHNRVMLAQPENILPHHVTIYLLSWNTHLCARVVIAIQFKSESNFTFQFFVAHFFLSPWWWKSSSTMWNGVCDDDERTWKVSMELFFSAFFSCLMCTTSSLKSPSLLCRWRGCTTFCRAELLRVEVIKKTNSTLKFERMLLSPRAMSGESWRVVWSNSEGVAQVNLIICCRKFFWCAQTQRPTKSNCNWAALLWQVFSVYWQTLMAWQWEKLNFELREFTSSSFTQLRTNIKVSATFSYSTAFSLCFDGNESKLNFLLSQNSPETVFSFSGTRLLLKAIEAFSQSQEKWVALKRKSQLDSTALGHQGVIFHAPTLIRLPRQRAAAKKLALLSARIEFKEKSENMKNFEWHQNFPHIFHELELQPLSLCCSHPWEKLKFRSRFYLSAIFYVSGGRVEAGICMQF